jgi:hypothetical protein
MAMTGSAATEAEILFEVVAPNRADVAPEAVRLIASLRFSEAQQERMRALAAKNNEGTITDAEREEMESFRRVGNFLAILQAKARLSLKQASRSC